MPDIQIYFDSFEPYNPKKHHDKFLGKNIYLGNIVANTHCFLNGHKLDLIVKFAKKTATEKEAIEKSVKLLQKVGLI